jgi:hypothetical protein
MFAAAFLNFGGQLGFQPFDLSIERLIFRHSSFNKAAGQRHLFDNALSGSR